MFIRLNYKDDFEVTTGNSYHPSPQWWLMDDKYNFNSKGIVGYTEIGEVPVYSKKSGVTITKGWFGNKISKDTISYEYLGTKTLYRYYRMMETPCGPSMSTFALDTLILGEHND